MDLNLKQKGLIQKLKISIFWSICLILVLGRNFSTNPRNPGDTKKKNDIFDDIKGFNKEDSGKSKDFFSSFT